MSHAHRCAHRALDDALDAQDLARAAKEYERLLASEHKAASIRSRYSNWRRPFTGSRELEEQFRESLSEPQKRAYERAMAERNERNYRFQKLLDSMESAETLAPVGETVERVE